MTKRAASQKISYTDNCEGIDWEQLRLDLIDDDFHNGRSTRQLQDSFLNSAHCTMAWRESRCIGNARALSDGVGNAYVVDVWTHSRYRGLGIGTALMNALLEKLHGQHVYLQTDDAAGFYRRLGFTPQPEGLHKIVGDYLDRPPE